MACNKEDLHNQKKYFKPYSVLDSSDKDPLISFSKRLAIMTPTITTLSN